MLTYLSTSEQAVTLIKRQSLKRSLSLSLSLSLSGNCSCPVVDTDHRLWDGMEPAIEMNRHVNADTKNQGRRYGESYSLR